MIYVSWPDAVEYAKWLSGQTGKRYRLPTEGEWEYAARGGRETAYWWGKDWVKGNGNCAGCGSRWDQQTAPVGSFDPNPFGLYDTAGNVWEWVADWEGPYDASMKENPTGPASGAKRIIRGGAWNGGFASWLRPSFRYAQDPAAKSHGIGFRCARSL